MKFSLRNLALAGAMTLAGVAMAQDAPFTVEKNWFKTYSGNTINEYRFGTGWNGKVYMTDKTNSKINAFDANGVTTVAEHAVAVNLTHDDAGNFLFHPSWAGAKDPTNWVIYNPTTNEFTDVEITLPEDLTANRMDFTGRAIGDVLSEEGGLLVFCPQTVAGNTAYVCIVKIAEGKQVELGFSDYASCDAAFTDTFDSTTIGQFTYTYDEVQDMGDDWANAIAIRKRGNNVPKVLDGTDWVKMPCAGKTKSSEGFDVFVLNDKLYLVNPAGAVNYTTRFVISDAETGEVVYESPVEDEVSLAAGQGFGAITANKVDDNTVEIYICGQTNASPGLTYTGMYTVKLPGGEDPTPAAEPLYMTGSNYGWNPAEPVEFVYADGKYTANITSKGEFKISTKKGTWDDFNAGVLGIDGRVLVAGETYDITDNTGNIVVAVDGNYALTVDLEAKTIALLGEANYPEALYVIGEVNGGGWNPAYDGAKLAKDEDSNWYRGEVKFNDGDAYFAIVSKLGVDSNDWSVNAHRFGADNKDQVVEEYAAMQMNFNENAWKIEGGKYEVAVSLDNLTFNVQKVIDTPQIKVNYWTNFGEEMEPEAQQMMMTEGSEGSEYTLVQDYMAGAFYFTTEMGLQSTIWGADSEDYENGVEIKVGEKTALAPEGAQFIVPGKGLTDATITLTFDSEGGFVKVEGTPVPDDDPVEEPTTADKAHFVYNVKHEGHVEGVYTIKFHSTGDAPKAVLVLNEVDGDDEIEAELGKVVKGENTFTYDASDLKEGKNYTWSVRLHGYEVPETKITEHKEVGGNRAGIVVFTDPAYPEVFGKVCIGRGFSKGFDIYSADGELEDQKLFPDHAVFNNNGKAANNSSPMDGKARGTEAVFASWGDAAYGVVAFDVATKSEPYSVFDGTIAGSGLVTNAAGEAIGSGTPCLAFQGKGEDTKLFTFDEDAFGNSLAMNPIGTDKTTSKAAENWGCKSALANTNVGMWATEKGLFFSQGRANGMDPNVYGLSYFDVEEQDIVWTIRDAATALNLDPDSDEGKAILPTSLASVCVNPAGDLLAVPTYTDIRVFLLDWEENAMGTLLPVLTPYETIKYDCQSVRTNLAFDAANNLHISNQKAGYCVATLAEKEPIALTAAHEQYTIANSSAVANIAVDAANGNAVYYNLNGVRVNGKLAAGVYVKVVDGKATKVVVK